MKYAVIRIVNGNFVVATEGWTDINKAKSSYYGTCQALYNEIASILNATFDSSLDADGYYYTNALAILENEVSFYFDEDEKAAPPPVRERAD